MTSQLKLREEHTLKRTAELRDELATTESLCVAQQTCVYMTGSFGRLEASSNSDLDLFVVGGHRPEGPLLGRLDATCVKADLIHATRNLGFPDFSGDGEYLEHYSIRQIIEKLGTQEDDSTNTFTARLLLLLESRPLLGGEVHESLVRQVVEAYWRDYLGHEENFIPAFLTNDVLRLWRTFCVNYEAGTRTEPELEKAKRKLKNYKLKHSRLLTCYSSLIFLLAVYSERKTVAPGDAIEMTRLTPTQRILSLPDRAQTAEGLRSSVNRLLEHYERFLEVTSAPKDELISLFLDRDRAKELMSDAYQFGDLAFEIISAVGCGNRFHRLLLV